MEGLRTKSSYSGTATKPVSQGIYDMGKIGAWKTWHVGPHVSAKGVKNKFGRYTSTYAPNADCNKTAER